MITRRTATIVAFVAAKTFLIAGVMAVAPTGQAEQPSVQQLPRVVVTGHVQQTQTAQIVELPRVVVTGTRAGVAPTLITQEEAAATAASRS